MKKERKVLLGVIAIVSIVLASGITLYLLQTHGRQQLTISTTTSLYDTGLLDTLKEEYENSHPEVTLAFISAGTGIAITHAMNGDADLILVHSPSQEYDFMNASYGVNRKIFAYNFFIIVGPTEDPAGIEGLGPIAALQRVCEYGRNQSGQVWVSRDDNSGTNTKEKGLWSEAGYDYDVIKNEAWFVSSGSGMGTTLNMANELQLYTLSDIGTFLKYSAEGLIELEGLVQAGESLLNVYSAIAVNSTKVQGVKFDLAMEFIQWIVNEEAQSIIENYGVEDLGSHLFYAAAQIVETSSPPDIYGWIRNYAFFKSQGQFYECPPEWRVGNYDLYSYEALLATNLQFRHSATLFPSTSSIQHLKRV